VSKRKKRDPIPAIVGPNMSENTEFVLVMAGGGGTRLWPVSRRTRPKQLLTLGGEQTLLAATVARAAAICGIENTLVVTARDQAAAVREAVPELPAENVVIEPAARNTAAAVGLGAAVIHRRAGRDARFAVLPSDAFIGDVARFVSTAKLALQHARQAIVTIGITPDRPETGYGYIEPGQPIPPGANAVTAFVEKPDAKTAERYVAAGYLWNAGMFFMSTGRLLDEADAHMPELGKALRRYVAAPDFEADVDATYASLPSVSIDYGIMEKTRGIRVLPGDFGWNDVGSWDALPVIRPADTDGNVKLGDAILSNSHGNIVVSEPGAPLVALTGIDDLVVVATRDAVLVMRKGQAQNVRDVVDAARKCGRTDLL